MLFTALHERCAADDVPIQMVEGIPYFYRPRPELTVDLYGRAARLQFTDGRLTAVTAARGSAGPSTDPGVDAAVPPDALLHLALGHRTLPQVLDAWPDCLPRDRLTERFLTVAFPRVEVRVWQRN